MSTETINWIDVNEELPDEMLTVLLKTPSPGEPVWPGWLENGHWIYADGSQVWYNVTHWAEMPRGPE